MANFFSDNKDLQFHLQHPMMRKIVELKGVRYLELTEGYINKLAVDANDEVIGYQFVKLGKMMEDIRHGKTPNEAYEKNVGTYGRFSKEQGAVKYIDPREE